MSRIASGALLGATAVAAGIAVATFIDPYPGLVVAREIAPPRVATDARPAPAQDQQRMARVGAALLVGLEWSRR